jgi:hypothetical protein
MSDLECSSGLASVRPGYWAYQVSRPEVSAYPIYETAQCPPNYCPGAMLQQMPNVSAQATTGTGGGGGSGGSPDIVDFTPIQCVYPRSSTVENLLCGGCVAGYIVWSGSCVSCTTINGGLVFALLLLSFALVLLLSRSTVGGGGGGSSQSAAGGTVVLLYFAQTAQLQIGPVAGWLGWLSFVNFDGGSSFSTCMGPMTPYEQMLLGLLTPIILMAQLAAVSCTHSLLQHTWLSHRLPSFSWSHYVGVLVSILLFCYTQVATTSLQYLACADVGSHRVVLRGNSCV